MSQETAITKNAINMPISCISIHNRHVVEAVVNTLNKYEQIFLVHSMRDGGSKAHTVMSTYKGHPFTTAAMKNRNAKFYNWIMKALRDKPEWYHVQIINPSKRTETYMEKLNVAMNMLGTSLGEDE